MPESNNTPSDPPKQPSKKGRAKLKIASVDGVSVAPETSINEAMLVLRRIAHKNHLVVEGPASLRGMSLTGFGRSNNPVYASKRYTLDDPSRPFEGAPISPDDLAELAALVPVLLAHREWSIFAEGGTNSEPTLQQLAEFTARDNNAAKDLLAEWEAQSPVLWPMTTDERVVGMILRLGEGATKTYLVFLRGPGGVYKMVVGQPLFDYPLIAGHHVLDQPTAGMKRLLENGIKPVMVHEGPKSARAAARIADLAGRKNEDQVRAILKKRKVPLDFARWLMLYEHVGVQGAEAGLPFVDFSPLRGRREVLFWSDVDKEGVQFSLCAAKMLAGMGTIASYIAWEESRIASDRGWDMADQWASMSWLTRTEARRRTRRVEAPYDNRGRLLSEWVKRSYVDKDEGLVYTLGRDYLPMKEKAIRDEFGEGAWKKICRAPVQEYRGSVFLPGHPLGITPDGTLNTCPPHMREGVAPRPLLFSEYRPLWWWLKRMMPNLKQRKFALRRAALLLAAPQHVPRSVVLWHGPSGSGKSFFMTLLERVNGKDRSHIGYPDDINGQFNEKIDRKNFVGIHEIHGTELNRESTTNKWKELVGNDTITIHRKRKDRVVVPNVIHWFAASNDEAPVDLRAGNDRFYFISAEIKSKAAMEKWAAKWAPVLLNDAIWHDKLYAAALSLAGGKNFKVAPLVARAPRQKVWERIRRNGWNSWQQFAADVIDKYLEGTCPYFIGDDVVRLVRKEFNNAGTQTIRSFLKENMQVRPLKRDVVGKPKVDRRTRARTGWPETVWCRNKDYLSLIDLKGEIPAEQVFTFSRLGKGGGLDGPETGKEEKSSEGGKKKGLQA